MKRIKGKHLDFSQIAHAVVQAATDENPSSEENSDKNPAAVALGRIGGLKGGKAAAARMTPEQRKQRAQKAAQARWGKK
jgi:hypothetical protein